MQNWRLLSSVHFREILIRDTHSSKMIKASVCFSSSYCKSIYVKTSWVKVLVDNFFPVFLTCCFGFPMVNAILAFLCFRHASHSSLETRKYFAEILLVWRQLRKFRLVSSSLFSQHRQGRTRQIASAIKSVSSSYFQGIRTQYTAEFRFLEPSVFKIPSPVKQFRLS